MQAKELIERIGSAQQTLSLKHESRAIRLRGVSGSLFSFLVAAKAQSASGVHVVVMQDREAASYLYNDLYNILSVDGVPEGRLYFMPTAYKRSIETQREDPSGIVQRTTVLTTLAAQTKNRLMIICTYPEAIAEQVVPREELCQNTLHMGRGETLSIKFVEQVLLEYGFSRVDFVYEPGQYAVRGGIVDVFSYSDNKPYRIEFFGDTIESLRTFDISSQLSLEQRSFVEVVPNLKSQQHMPSRVSFAQYVAQATLWVNSYAQLLLKIDDLRSRLLSELADPSTIDHQTTSSVAFSSDIASWSVVAMDSTGRSSEQEIDFESTPQPTFNKNFALLASHIRLGGDVGVRTYLLTDNLSQAERLDNILLEISKTKIDNIPLTIHSGFCWSGMNLFTDHQLFDRYQKYKIYGELERSESMTIAELNALKIGDYVVHIDHGVGRFGGLVRTTDATGQREFIKLTYRDGDVLMVNVHSLHRISKYKDGDTPVSPVVHKLGGGAWAKLKATTKSRVKDIARSLIALYAQRKASVGFAYSADTYLQAELESSFIYEDTPDQRSATDAIKADMEAQQPMDRLVCGDVGFGKTEVAMRAAFKAATDGKQVAMLVPTTLLSLQHFKTFTRRLKNFPVRIENFSRAKSAKQTTEILKELAAGKIDIIIGTHKLLGKGVQFKDLGLLIVDEEQKFGVTMKERLRQIKSNVDTLTLTATPIPRTLQFSLMGARDLSIINTPPPNRQPVATEVYTFNETIIKEAIDYEMQRGGQVFFLHNRVQSLPRILQTIRTVCPEARVAVGHGQMSAMELEKIMMEFIYGEYDVLLATTIIESGIDIPNANTMIINNAQMFGLSDLHQLRGRVGRTNRKAYCYLLIPSEQALTSDAHRRLRAIEDFSDLGSGFNIAMQDLDIRGAGNILGAEQSGFVGDMGFETYQKIMAEAVAELRAEQGLEVDTSTIDCTIETDTIAYLPDDYIGSTAEKIRIYRELDALKESDRLDTFASQMRDRFGELPPQAAELLEVVRLRSLAENCGIEKITVKNGLAFLYFVADELSPFYKSERFMTILRGVSAKPSKFKLATYNNKLRLTVRNITSILSLYETLNALVR
ncbi:MAG: transcription-repair coupling factor [Mucinivorans sp.]